jgi:hypothetical protein
VSIDVPLHHPHVMIFKASLSRFLSSCVELSGVRALAGSLRMHMQGGVWRTSRAVPRPMRAPD